jgi:hypothetical protein
VDLTIGQHGLGELVKSTWQNRKFAMWTLQFGKMSLKLGTLPLEVWKLGEWARPFSGNI